MKSKRRLILLGVAAFLVMIIVFAYVMIRSSGEEDAYRIAVVVENSGNEMWNSFRLGAENAAADYNVLLDFVTTTNFDSADDQFRVIDRQIQGGANAIVAELIESYGTADRVKEISGKAVLALTGTDIESDVDIEGKSATIAPDNYQIGRALGNEVLLRHQKGLEGLKVGIICKRYDKHSIRDRLTGLVDILEIKDADIRWFLVTDEHETGELVPAKYGRVINNQLKEEVFSLTKKVYKNDTVDIIIALDDESLQTAAELYADIENAFDMKSTAYNYQIKINGGLAPPFELYGEGISTQNLSYLDRGKIVSMIVPNEFKMGYEAVEKAVTKLDHKLAPMEDTAVEYRVINQENMFKDDNQKYLFTIIQ